MTNQDYWLQFPDRLAEAMQEPKFWQALRRALYAVLKSEATWALQQVAAAVGQNDQAVTETDNCSFILEHEANGK